MTDEKTIKENREKANKFLEKFKGKNKLASILTESRLSNISEYISSGSYGMNKVISGSYFKGFPNNRVMVIAGPSKAGKTYLCLSTAREAQKKGYQVVYFDSENAIDKNFATNLGVDADSLIHIPVKTISQFRNESVAFMREWRTNDDTKNIPLIMFMDSVGNLVGTKELNDVEADKSASDMGQRAKELRGTARVLTCECAENSVPLIVTNHTYEQQNMMGAPTIKMGGGEGFVYASSGIIILESKLLKEDSGDKDSENRKVIDTKGSLVIAKSDKNRLVPVGTRSYMYIDFKRGVNPVYGLLDDAIEHGFIEKAGAWYNVKHLDKKIREKDLYTKEVWQPILKPLNQKIEEIHKYAEHDVDTDELDFIENSDTESSATEP
jgi:RecA/RadA recombinase